jgi:hypothetical protein
MPKRSMIQRGKILKLIPLLRKHKDSEKYIQALKIGDF